ncbi:DUF4430 domain-containing protein [Anaerosalibacter bizertensis]|uniref:DUF4430 domain-containing protein n=1 Tax=Anaerosalibacter bizertensis TaxID=932217 RepID=UPI001C0EED5A|nr:DUF4430 domain-containing protein [Anaerosalibacter bizertensis]MBU5294566.1 DUF4430 domain-containing protein [Anaerosalibacter bizertensis]
MNNIRSYKKLFSILLLVTLLLPIIFPMTEVLAATVTIDPSDEEPSLSKDAKGTYIIKTVEDINTFREDIDKGIDYTGLTVELLNDIDIAKSKISLNSFKTKLNEYGEEVVGIFNGIFDGNGYSIKNYNDKVSGFFCVVGPNAVLRNFNIHGDIVLDDADAILFDVYNDSNSTSKKSIGYGMLASSCAGEVVRCSSSGSIVNKLAKIRIGGLIGESQVYIKKHDGNKIYYGNMRDCYSRVNFDNQYTKDMGDIAPKIGGLAYDGGNGIIRSYFAGTFKGYSTNSISEYREIYSPIWKTCSASNAESGETCAYDKDTCGFHLLGSRSGKKYTTEEMKKKETFTTEKHNFDFEYCWSIDPNINDGYPYLDAKKLDKKETIYLDVQGIAEDKIYDEKLSMKENLKTNIKDINFANLTPEMEELIDKYNVKLNWKVNPFKSPSFDPIHGDKVKVNVDYESLELEYDANQEYLFKIGKVLPVYAKFKDNGRNVLTKEEKDEKIEKLKELEDYVVNTIRDRHGFLIKDIPEMSYERKKDQWGDNIILDDHDWFVFSAARMGYIPEENPEFYDDWFEEIQKFMANLKEEGIDVDDIHADSISKLILAVSATGYDIRDIEGWDLLGSLTKPGRQMSGYFSSQYSFFARHSQDYPMSKEIKEKDEKMIHDQAKYLKDRNGGSAADMVVMSYQPSLYFNNVEGYEDVTEAVQLMKKAFSEHQTAEGTFWGGFANDTHNIWTNAQVYMNINIAGLDPFDPMFIKNGNTIVEPYLKGEYFNFENKMLSPMITYEIGQIIRGFDSVVRAYEGRTHIFDCRDLEDTLGLKTSTVTVNNQILSLTEDSTPEEVAAARDAYNGPGSKLTDRQRKSMRESTIKHLEDIEKKVIENPDKEAADRINKLINELKLDKFTNENKEAVKAARKAYEALTEEQKKLVDIEKLEAAEKKMDELEIKNFKSLVEALGGISNPPTEENIKAIEKAENAYKNMSKELKKDLEVIAAKFTLDGIIEKINEEPEDKEVKLVVEAIKELPITITLEDKPAVEAVRNAYNALDEKQKEKVGVENLKILEEAEKIIKELESEDDGQVGTITFALERFTLGQGYFVEPMEVPIYKGENCRDILDRILGKENVIGKYDYVEAIKGADKGEINIPEELLSMIEENPTNGQSFHGELNEPGQLGEFDYSSMSGWMYSVNNVLPNVGMNAYTPKDGDVFRVHFTLWGYGADLGQDFPGGTSPLPVGDKTALTKKIAEINGKPNKDKLLKDQTFKEVYDYVYKTIQRVTVSDEELDECVKLLDVSMKKADEKIIKEVENMISKLPEIDKLTLNDKGKVEEVRKAYDELTAEQRKLVSNADKLIEVEDKIVELEAIEKDKEKERNKKAADKVIKQIESLKLDKFTNENKEAVKVARKAYEALTDDQKKLVDVEKLESAEKRIKELEIENFRNLVEDIGEISKPAREENIKAVKEAENAYNNMSEELRKDSEVIRLKGILDEAKNKLDEDIAPDNDNKDTKDDNNKPPKIDPEGDKTGGSNGKVIDINDKKENPNNKGKRKLPATGTDDKIKYVGIGILFVGLLLLSKKHFKLAKNNNQDK